MARAAVDRNLEALGQPTATAPAAAIARLVGAIAGWSANEPWALLGPLHVVEGSRMGSMVLCRSLGRAFGLDPRRAGTGLDYHTDG